MSSETPLQIFDLPELFTAVSAELAREKPFLVYYKTYAFYTTNVDSFCGVVFFVLEDENGCKMIFRISTDKIKFNQKDGFDLMEDGCVDILKNVNKMLNQVNHELKLYPESIRLSITRYFPINISPNKFSLNGNHTQQ